MAIANIHAEDATTGPAVAMLLRLEHDLRVYKPRSRMSLAEGAIEQILYMIRNSDEISEAAFKARGEVRRFLYTIREANFSLTEKAEEDRLTAIAAVEQLRGLVRDGEPCRYAQLRKDVDDGDEIYADGR